MQLKKHARKRRPASEDALLAELRRVDPGSRERARQAQERAKDRRLRQFTAKIKEYESRIERGEEVDWSAHKAAALQVVVDNGGDLANLFLFSLEGAQVLVEGFGGYFDGIDWRRAKDVAAEYWNNRGARLARSSGLPDV